MSPRIPPGLQNTSDRDACPEWGPTSDSAKPRLARAIVCINRAGFVRVGYMPRLDLDVDASEMQDPLAPRNQVLRPVASHAPARQDEQALAISHDEDCDVGGFAGLAAIRREGDLLLSGGRIDHVMRKGAHLHSNRPRPPAIPSRHCPQRLVRRPTETKKPPNAARSRI